MVCDKMSEDEIQINIFKSRLVPECRILSEDETIAFLEKFNISKQQLPRIHASDPVAKALEANSGDVMKITRKSKTAGLSNFYRLVVGVA